MSKYVLPNGIAVYSIEFSDGVAVPVGAANTGVLRYNDTTGVFEQSLDGAAWTALVPPASASTLAATYTAGASAADQTLTISGADGDHPIFSVAAVGVAQTPGLALKNPTLATAGGIAFQKYSPLLELEGQGWKTNATAGSQVVKWGIQTRPVEGTANPTAELVFWKSVDGAAMSEIATFTDAVGSGFGGLYLGPVSNGNWLFGGAGQLFLRSSTVQLVLASSGYFGTQGDIATTLGNASNRWSTIYQGNDTVADDPVEGLNLSNKALAATGVGNQQHSPMLALEGQGWKTDATAGSQVVKWGLQTRPVEGTAAPNGDLVFWKAIGAGAYAEVLKFSDSVTGYPGIYGVSATAFSIGYGNTYKLSVSSGGNYSYDHFNPSPDAAYNLGQPTYRWNTIYEGINGIATAKTVGLSMTNETVATTGAQQYSPMISLRGQRYSGAATKTAGWNLQAAPRTIASANGDGTDAGSLILSAHYDGANTDLWAFDHNAGTPRLRPMVGPGIISSPDGNNNIAFYDSVLVMTGVGMRPAAAGVMMGGAGWGWAEVMSRLYNSDTATTLTITANAVTQTRSTHFIGAGLLKTITKPAFPTTWDGWIYIIPTAAFTMDTTDNIVLPGGASTATASVSELIIGYYDSGTSKWYLSFSSAASGTYLPLGGGTMAGSIEMAANSITSTTTAKLVSSAADGATAVAASISTGAGAAWSNSASSFLTIYNNSVEKLAFRPYDTNQGIMAIYGGTGASMKLASASSYLGTATTSIGTNYNIANGIEFTLATAITYKMLAASFSPATDATGTLGTSALRWGDTYVGHENVLQAATAGITISNKTAATAGPSNQQYSPTLRLEGQQHNATTSVPVAWELQTRSRDTRTDTAYLDFLAQYNSGTRISAMQMYTTSTNTSGLQTTIGGSAGAALIFADGNVTLYSSGTGTGVMPYSDLTHNLGSTATRWNSIHAQTHAGTQQDHTNITGTITIDPAGGDVIKITAGDGNITGITISAGTNGQTIKLILKAYSSADRTWPTDWTNVIFAGGGFSKGVQANVIDTLILTWDNASALWCEMSRAMALAA